MYYENLPIFRSAMNLAVYIETIVKSLVLASFRNSALLYEKYHKYTIGVNLRERTKCHCVLAVGTLLEFFDKKIKAVSLYSQTLSLSDTINKYQHTSKPINLKTSLNFFAVLSLPTGYLASEGHSINFAKQNSSNVPAVKTQWRE